MSCMQAGGYSETARHAVTIAHDAALRLGRTCVSVDLIVLGIIDADAGGLAARALQDLGVVLAALRLRITGLHEPPAQVTSAGTHVPFCAETRASLAGPETGRPWPGQIETLHILLALVGGAEVRLTELFAPFGVHPRQIRTRAIRLLAN